MLAKVFAPAQIGMDGQLVEIECDMSSSLPGLIIVGLGNKAVAEARDRVRSAIKNSHLMVPPKKITLNLAPADLPKDGTAYDLGMAIAILIASEQLKPVNGSLFIGELALDGSVRAVPGILSYIRLAQRLGISKIYLPAANIKEASLLKAGNLYPVDNLYQLFLHLDGQSELSPVVPGRYRFGAAPDPRLPLFEDVYGQAEAKRALLVAVAGGHNILLSGPPGSGKTMLSKAAFRLLPPPDTEEIIEILQLYSLAGQTYDQPGRRPFRSPHHSASISALIGGGRLPRPGEISLSHRGILFLDELPEFDRETLEALRQPLEDGVVTIARAAGVITFPARFMLVAAQNPCPCGYAGDSKRTCDCKPPQISRYRKKVSGPLLDRIDMMIHVRRVDPNDLRRRGSAVKTSDLSKQIKMVRSLQKRRFRSPKTNSEMNNDEIERFAKLEPAAQELAMNALQRLNISTRGYMRLRRVARTIADLDGSSSIEAGHLAEALQYRTTG